MAGEDLGRGLAGVKSRLIAAARGPLLVQATHAGEATIPAASVGLPGSWAACLSTSEPARETLCPLASNGILASSGREQLDVMGAAWRSGACAQWDPMLTNDSEFIFVCRAASEQGGRQACRREYLCHADARCVMAQLSTVKWPAWAGLNLNAEARLS